MNGNYVVDTNVIIKMLKADERAVELFEQAEKVDIPVIVAGELIYGAENSTRKQENLNIFSDFLSQYNIIEVDLQIAQVYGEIKAQLKRDGLTIPENDIWIAATAKTKHYTLLTFDGHFSQINGLNVKN